MRGDCGSKKIKAGGIPEIAPPLRINEELALHYLAKSKECARIVRNRVRTAGILAFSARIRLFL